jgi:hypothetical protein
VALASRDSSGRFVKNQISGNLRKVKKNLPQEIARALYQEVEVEVTEVKKRTPVDKGPLRASVHQEGPFFEGDRLYSKIVAGGVAAPYAIFVHENLEAFHKVGQAKYLESVILESRAYMAARVALRMDMNRLLK